MSNSTPLNLREMSDRGLLRQLAIVFNSAARATLLLDDVRYPLDVRPVFGNFRNAEEFWREVCSEIEQGVLPDQRLDDLVGAARKRYLGNPVFRLDTPQPSGGPPVGTGERGESRTEPPCFVHDLDPAPAFQPRGESDRLRAFWARDVGGVLAVTGIGGTGKTALVERFLCELPGSSVDSPGVDKRGDLPPPDALFVWSFYHSPRCEEFFERLWIYLCPMVSAGPDVEARRSTIQTALGQRSQSRTLLVLDGLEKVQTEGEILGRFADDAAPLRRFLQWSASHTRGVWVVVTSRLAPAELDKWRDRGYELLPLDQLEPASARALLRARGVKGSDEELRRLADDFGRHPLTLTHLGGLLGRFYGGDPKEAGALPPIEERKGFGAELDLQARQLIRVLTSYEGKLAAEELSVLKAVSAFRLPVTADVLIGTFECAGAGFVDKGLTPPARNRLRAVLTRLTEMHLLQEHRTETASLCYSAHPAVSQHFYRALLEDALLLHEGASRYLQRQLHRYDIRVGSTEEDLLRMRGGASLWAPPTRGPLPRDRVILDLLEELIFHALRRGDLEQAFSIYRDNLGGYDHLGGVLGDAVRGQRIVAQFLTPAPTDESRVLRYRHQLARDHASYRAMLGEPPEFASGESR